MIAIILGVLVLVSGINAHIAAWTKGMYCVNVSSIQLVKS